MELLCCLLAGEGHGNLQTYCPQFCGNQTYHSLIIFTPGTQLNIYVVLIPVISEHWTDSSVVVWLQLWIFGMGFQLMWFSWERFLAGALCLKMCIVVYALDLYGCIICVWGFITVKYYIRGMNFYSIKFSLCMLLNLWDLVKMYVHVFRDSLYCFIY